MAQNYFIFPQGKAVGSAVIASGEAVLGDLATDKDGNVFRIVLASDEAIADGRALAYKEGDSAKSVILSNAASGEAFAGVARLNLDPNTSAATGEVFFTQIAGVCDVFTGPGTAALGDSLVMSASGSLDVLTAEDSQIVVAFADEAGVVGSKTRVILK